MPSKCGPKKDEMREDWREIYKKELYNSYCYQIFLVECTEKFSFQNLAENRQLERPRHGGEDSNEMHL